MTAPDTEYGPPPEVPLHEVEWRIDGKPVQRDDTWRCRYVPYIDARWCAAGLDTWVGPHNWRRDHTVVSFMGKEIIECFVSIRFDGEWVTKSDAGWNNGNPDVAIKGSYSDAFKRAACGTWGVGRNVYDLPGDIWAECKVWMRPGKNGGPAEPVARPHPNAVMQIRQELEKRGHEILHVTAQPIVQGQRVSSDTDVAEPPETLSPDQIAQIAAVLTENLTGETLSAAKARLFQEYGKLADLPETRFDEALSGAQAILDDLKPSPPAAEEPTEQTGEAAQDPGGDPSPAPPGPAYTADEVNKMTLKTLTEELIRYSLPTTGKMDEKRARLLEAMARSGGRPTMADWVAGDEFDRHPETSEKLHPVPQYIEGIDRYESDLTDEQSQAWEAWMSENLAEVTWPNLTQHQAFTAWEAIHHLSTKGALP